LISRIITLAGLVRGMAPVCRVLPRNGFLLLCLCNQAGCVVPRAHLAVSHCLCIARLLLPCEICFGRGAAVRAPWRRIAAVIVDGSSNIPLVCIPFGQSLFPHPLYTIVIAWMEIPRLSVSIEIIIFYIFSREIVIEQPHLPPTPPPPPIIDDLNHE
jgi:hypothetical protein